MVDIKPVLSVELNLKKLTVSRFLFFILIGICFFTGCESNRSAEFPEKMAGIWATDNARYKDRFIEIDENRIAFGTGSDSSNVFYVEKIRKVTKDSTERWIFHCTDIEGSPFEFAMHFQTGSDEKLLMLRNMEEIIWYKADQFE